MSLSAILVKEKEDNEIGLFHRFVLDSCVVKGTFVSFCELLGRLSVCLVLGLVAALAIIDASSSASTSLW